MRNLIAAALLSFLAVNTAHAQTITFEGNRLPFEFNTDSAGTAYEFTSCPTGIFASAFRAYMSNGRYVILGFSTNLTPLGAMNVLANGATHPGGYCVANANDRPMRVSPEQIRYIVKIAG